uniref:Uncharacterized protein n=1 Tax=viral metagenome TaxID=1070528 RepID=A0A6C0K0D5_9ZZZZ
MKRKYEIFVNPPPQTIKRKGGELISLHVSKKAKKEPMLRFVALFRGYLARKWWRLRQFLFYR